MCSQNSHISECSNSALALASGEFVVLLDHDDLIPEHCLWMVAFYINSHPECKVLFSDEDKIGKYGQRQDPYFKGAFDEYLLYGHNMVTHLGVYRRSLVEASGGFRRGFEGAQDYDLIPALLRQMRSKANCAYSSCPLPLTHDARVHGDLRRPEELCNPGCENGD